MSSADGSAAGAEWVPPTPSVPITREALMQTQGGAVQNKVELQNRYCPVCPPPPSAAAYTAQRKNFESHFRNQHPAYTFVDNKHAAASLGS